MYRVEWANNCLVALQLHGHTQSKDLRAATLFHLGPSWSLNVAHTLDDTHLVVYDGMM